ncbi:lipopolysaccharide biosynthesis protein [Nocardioides sp. R-C-SC26]|uniref:lipopolysaccharide biosynthesis protein n=1 Tax=Nocardioides sp. R-C-SC26 TaxID=2870414 RepID=UPI001E42862A|nr:polysaccharide biosynthesis protein [Nocardioides sp. R-C-SC26]
MSEPVPTPQVAEADRPGSGGSAVAVAIAVMNIATYGFTIIAARGLGPQQYGAFAAVMNLLLVVSVLSLALQATAARRISSTPDDVAIIETGVLRVAWRAALSLGLLLIVAAPLVNHVLRLESLATAVLVGLIAVPSTLMGGQAGVLQGERRWRSLAILYVAAGVPRLVIGAALILWRPEEFTATLGVLLGALVPVVVGAIALRDRVHVSHRGSDAEAIDHGARALVRESVRNSHALLGYFAVCNVDVIMARTVLDNHDSGLYAAGLILAKAVLFLPQFVVVLAFPEFADDRARRRALRLSLGLVGVLGVFGIAASVLLSDIALVFVGGAEYRGVQDHLWQFALLGTLLSMIQLLVYALLARAGTGSVRVLWVLWVALGAVIAGSFATDSVTSLLTVVTVIDVVLLAVLLRPALRR